jgi:hypothetical protein
MGVHLVWFLQKKKGSTKGNPQQLFTQAIKDGI